MLTYITKNSVGYLTSESYQEAKRWEDNGPKRLYPVYAVMILGIAAIVVGYASVLPKQ